MKKFLFSLMLSMAGITGVINAQTFQVAGCSGTLGTPTYGPMYSVAGANATSRKAFLYPSSQLAGITGVPVTDIYFHRFSTTGTMAGTPNFKIYLKEIPGADFGAGTLDWATSITGAALVYDGDPAAIVGSGNGWKKFPLLSNFTFSGTQNLAVFTEYTNATASDAIEWTYEYTAPCVATGNNNTGKYSQNTTGTLPTGMATSNYRRPYIGFDLQLSCNVPTSLQSANVTGSAADISWTAPTPAPAGGYEYYYNTTGTAPTSGTTPSGATGAGVIQASLGGLTAGTYYHYWVRSVCGVTDKSPWSAVANFSTLAPNDECAGAIPLPVGATCTNTAGSTVGATESQPAAPCTGNPDDDVWFSFIPNNTDAQITISSVSAVIGTSTTTYFQVLSGSCGSLSSIMCSAGTSGIAGNLTPGNTYYIRVYTSLATSRINFNICVNDVTAAPTVCTSLSSPAANAQVSTSPTLTWTATAGASAYDIYLDANNPPSTLFTTVYNSNRTSYAVSPALSAGTYYWYVVPKNSLGEMGGCEANARAFNAADPPANDDCATATVLTASATTTCSTIAGSTLVATQSSQAAPSCSATGINDDVWYSFTAVNTAHYISLSGATNTTAAAVYAGTDCSALTQITGACASTSSGSVDLLVTGLSIGTIYYVRVYTTTATATTSSNFNICITSPPANDECTGAIALPAPSTTFTCSAPVSGSTTGATASSTAAPTCSGTGINDDVWYSFVANTNTHTVVIGNASVTTAAVIYSGTCGTLTALSCASGGATANNLTPGNTYYVRVYSTSSTEGTISNFNICVVSGAPANDECTGAISLTPSANQVCSGSIAGSTSGASASNETAPSCSATGTNDDVWYSFVATSASHNVVISNATNTTAAAVYSGSCGSLVQVANACGSGADGSAAATGLTIGNLYYVRVYTTASTLTFSNFDICIISGGPANDNCGNAQALTVSADNSCTNAVAGSTLGATASVETAPSCSATGVNDDVWYSFTATQTTHVISLNNATATTAAAVYSGSCGSLTQVTGACASTNVVAAALTVGNVYYVRVYTTSTTTGTYSNFDICIGVLPPNDNCANASTLVASPDGNCNAVFGTTAGATQTAGETAPTCSAGGINDDVWYTFTATATTHIVSITNASSTTAAAVYSGSCGSLVEIVCTSTTATATNLTIGNVYYVRVYTTSTTASTYANFNICISGVPVNNECASSATLTGGIPVNGNTTGATQSQAPETCGTATATAANDVWYQFTASSSGSAVIVVNNVAAALDVVVHVYSGACGSLTNIGCADGPGDGGTETVTLNGLVAGQTYYVRVYGFAAGDIGTFTITVSGAALPVAIEYFNGNKQNNGNTLQWKLNCIQSLDTKVVLERSIDGRRFEPVYSENITAARCQQPFLYNDASPKAGLNYYRLKITDADGKVTYSNIVAILNKLKGVEIVSLSPNPVYNTAILNVVTADATRSEIIMTDLTGRQIQKLSYNLMKGDNKIPVAVNKLSAGLYYLTITTSEGESKTTRFVKE